MTLRWVSAGVGLLILGAVATFAQQPSPQPHPPPSQPSAQQQAAKAQAIEAAYRGAIRTPEQMAMAAHGGPTNAAAQAAPGMAPGFDQNALIRGLTQADTMAAAMLSASAFESVPG